MKHILFETWIDNCIELWRFFKLELFVGRKIINFHKTGLPCVFPANFADDTALKYLQKLVLLSEFPAVCGSWCSSHTLSDVSNAFTSGECNVLGLSMSR
jgi:hypothetical protein